MPTSKNSKKGLSINTAIQEQFIETIGLSAETDGLPRIAGRILGLFVLQGGPISFADLAKMLQVSRASISNNAKLLMTLGVIERISIAGDRQDYYQLADKPYIKLMQGHLERSKNLKSKVSKAIVDLSDESDAMLERLSEMEKFYEYAVWYLESVIDKMAE